MVVHGPVLCGVLSSSPRPRRKATTRRKRLGRRHGAYSDQLDRGSRSKYARTLYLRIVVVLVGSVDRGSRVDHTPSNSGLSTEAPHAISPPSPPPSPTLAKARPTERHPVRDPLSRARPWSSSSLSRHFPCAPRPSLKTLSPQPTTPGASPTTTTTQPQKTHRDTLTHRRNSADDAPLRTRDRRHLQKASLKKMLLFPP